MRALAATELLTLPVRMHGIALGKTVDVLLDVDEARVVGLEVLCGDGARRFLPFAVGDVRAGEVAVESALMLLDERDLGYYRSRTRRLADVALVEPWVGEDGRVREARSAA